MQCFNNKDHGDTTGSMLTMFFSFLFMVLGLFTGMVFEIIQAIRSRSSVASTRPGREPLKGRLKERAV